MTRSRQRKPSTSKVVVDKDKTDKFAKSSATLSHLYRYPLLVDGVDKIVNLPLVNVVLSWIFVVAGNIHQFLVESPRAPRFIKVGYNVATGWAYKLDELFALLVLREGLSVFIGEWKNHNGRLGFWLFYFWVDYWANVVNILLTRFFLSSNTAAATSDQNEKSLPHVEQLADTTRSISNDLQDKMQNGYLPKTVDYARTKYDELFKPVADRVQTDYVQPTKEHALGTYKTVSSTYKTNLDNSESIPRAIVSTGVDLKNITLSNLKPEKEDTATGEQIQKTPGIEDLQVSAPTVENSASVEVK